MLKLRTLVPTQSVKDSESFDTQDDSHSGKGGADDGVVQEGRQV